MTATTLWIILGGLAILGVGAWMISLVDVEEEYRHLEDTDVPAKPKKAVPEIGSRKVKITQEKFDEVKSKPNWPVEVVMQKTGVSRRTVSRIRQAKNYREYRLAIRYPRLYLNT